MHPQQIHFVLQGKGGVGKSLVASFLAQYAAERIGAVHAFDTDPVNATLAHYRALQARRVEILTLGNTIDARAFDQLMEQLVESEAVCVVDNGAASFVPLMAYLVENQALDMLRDGGKEVLVHSVVTGGQAFDDTLQGLAIMLTSQDAPVVVWLNEFFGEIERDGKTFHDSALYRAHQGGIRGVVRIEKGNADTFGKDMELMAKSHLTFAEALDSPAFGIMPRQRLKMVRGALFAQLDKVLA